MNAHSRRLSSQARLIVTFIDGPLDGSCCDSDTTDETNAARATAVRRSSDLGKGRTIEVFVPDGCLQIADLGLSVPTMLTKALYEITEREESHRGEVQVRAEFRGTKSNRQPSFNRWQAA